MRILRAIKRRIVFFLVNKIWVGTRCFEQKRKALNAIGFSIGEGSKIVGPIFCSGMLEIGRNCWIGKDFSVYGNGTVTIGDNCDVAPEVAFMTGGHEIGGTERRAGNGKKFHITVGGGTWIGGRATFFNEVVVGSSCVIAGGACVAKGIPSNSLAGGFRPELLEISMTAPCLKNRIVIFKIFKSWEATHEFF